MKYKNKYIGKQFKKIYDDGVYTLKPTGLQREGKKYVTYNLADSMKRIENGEYILMLEKDSEGTKKEEKKKNINEKEYRKYLEIESQNIVSPNSKKLISDIAFFIDLENDFDHDSHRKYLHKLLHNAYDLLVQDIEIHKGSMGVNLAVIGNFSSGKSSFINSLIGRELCPVKVNPTTSSITRFIYSDKPKIMLVNEGKEITSEEYMDLVQHSDINKMDKTKSYQIDYYYPFEEMRDIIIYDTPGFENPKNKIQDDKVTMKQATETDVIFLLIDIQVPEIDAKLLEKVKMIKSINSLAKWHLIVNKADTKPSPTDREKILSSLKSKYSDLFEDIVIFSSKNSNSYINFDRQLENIYKKIKEQIEEALAKKVLDVDLHLNMKKNGNSKIYDCYIGDSCIGELQAEKDIDKLKKKQKHEVLSILKDIGSNKYSFLSSKFDTEFNLYELDVKKVIRSIQNNLNEGFSNKSKSEPSLSNDDIEIFLFEIKIKLKNKKLLTAIFEVIIDSAYCVKVDKDEKNFWSSPYWKWEFNDNILIENLDISQFNHIGGLLHELEEKYILDKNREYSLFPNIEDFLALELWDALIEFLIENDKYYFDEEIDACLYKAEIYYDLNVGKAMDKEQKHFFDAIDMDIDALKDLLLSNDANPDDALLVRFGKEKQNEIYEKINTYLGEENVR